MTEQGSGSLLASVRRRMAELLGADERQRGPVTVVSGLPRSGTSMMMQMLERGGIAPLADGVRARDEDNPRGYYEFERVKRLPDGDTAWLDEARGKAVKVISALLPHLPEGYRYEVVFMQRDVDEVLASQRRMLQRQGLGPDGEDEGALRQAFLAHRERSRDWARGREDVRTCSVDYNAIVDEPLPELERIEVLLSTPVDVGAMADVVDPELYRQRVSRSPADANQG